jgi:hypothetical protein
MLLVSVPTTCVTSAADAAAQQLLWCAAQHTRSQPRHNSTGTAPLAMRQAVTPYSACSLTAASFVSVLFMHATPAAFNSPQQQRSFCACDEQQSESNKEDAARNTVNIRCKRHLQHNY